MGNYSELPALKLLVLVLAGTVLGIFVPAVPQIIIPLTVIIALTSFVLFRLKHFNPLIILFCAGTGLLISFNINFNKLHYPSKVIPEINAIFTGKINKILSKDDNYTKLIATGDIESAALGCLNNQPVIISVLKSQTRTVNLFSGQTFYSSLRLRTPIPDLLTTDMDEIKYAEMNECRWYARTGSDNLAVLSEPSGINYLREKILNSIYNRFAVLFGEGSRSIAYALVTGDQTKIKHELKQAYSLSGTVHVLAVSGLHVGLISGFIFILLGFIRNRTIKFFIFSLMITGYIFITGFQPSALRAGLMSELIMLTYCIQKRVNLLNILCLAVLLLIISNPMLLISPGFQMSAFSVLGITLFYQTINDKLIIFSKTVNQFWRYLISSVSLTFSASITVTPIVAYYFGTYSIISVIANIIIVPLISLSLVMSLIGLGISFISISLASFYSDTADLLIQTANNINSFFVSVPFAFYKTDNLFILAILISIILIYIIRTNNLRALLIKCLLFLFLFVFIMFPKRTNMSDLQIYPRKNIVATILNTSYRKNFVILVDRKPFNYPFRDYPLEQYLAGLKDSMIIAVTGLSGLAVTDEIKKVKKIGIVELSLDEQKRLNKLIINTEHLSQVIDLNK